MPQLLSHSFCGLTKLRNKRDSNSEWSRDCAKHKLHNFMRNIPSQFTIIEVASASLSHRNSGQKLIIHYKEYIDS